MKSSNLLAGIAVALGIIIACAVIGGGAVNSEPDAKCKLEGSIVDSFSSSSGYEVKPSAGHQYYILKYTVFNERYSDGISTNPYTFSWKATINGLSYDYTWDTYSHPGNQTVTIEKGAIGSQVLVFEIPAGTPFNSVQLSYSYNTIYPPNFIYDQSI